MADHNGEREPWTARAARDAEMEVARWTRVLDATPRLHFFESPDPELPNGSSAARAFPFATERTLLLMADHVFAPSMITELARSSPRGNDTVLAVDRDLRAVFDLDDATKVRTDGARLVAIGKDLEDYAHAKLIVLWGVNPSTSGVHLVPYVRAAQKNGARLVVIDPRTTPMAKQADIHLAVRPGTDLPIALSIHRYLFESGQADAAFLARHARGVERLRERAREWTFEPAAGEAGVPADALAQVSF